MLSSLDMAPPESPAQRIARQMRELMDRHHVHNAPQLERMFTDRGEEPISYVTINRILKGEARTRPNPNTLHRVAKILGETLAQAFPEPDEERAPVVMVNGRRVAIKALDGPPLTQREAEALLGRLDDDDDGKSDPWHTPTPIPTTPVVPLRPRPRGSR